MVVGVELDEYGWVNSVWLDRIPRPPSPVQCPGNDEGDDLEQFRPGKRIKSKVEHTVEDSLQKKLVGLISMGPAGQNNLSIVNNDTCIHKSVKQYKYK